MRLSSGLRLGDIAGGGVVAEPSSLLTGLVSYWTLDETSGQRNDSVGTNHLTDNNTVGSDTGMHNAAASFVMANNESLTVTAELPTTYSVSLWVNTSATAGVVGNVVALRDGVLGHIIYGENSAEGLTYARLDMYDGIGWQIAGAAWVGAQAVKGWTHLIGTMDATAKTMTLYEDNVLRIAPVVFDGSPGNFAADHLVKVGREATHRNIPDAVGWAPLIDEVAIWSRVLSEDERTALYAAGAGVYYPTFE